MFLNPNKGNIYTSHINFKLVNYMSIVCTIIYYGDIDNIKHTTILNVTMAFLNSMVKVEGQAEASRDVALYPNFFPETKKRNRFQI